METSNLHVSVLLTRHVVIHYTAAASLSSLTLSPKVKAAIGSLPNQNNTLRESLQWLPHTPAPFSQVVKPHSFHFSFFTVLDVDAFERLLGPCMEIMKRNAEGYEKQLIQIFGSKSNIRDIR